MRSAAANFPASGSILPDEFISKKPIPEALAAVAEKQLHGGSKPSCNCAFDRVAPVLALETPDESVVEAAVRISASMSGGCLVIQGPPGTGKTYTAARMIRGLLAAGKRVGVVSNSHKAVTHLLWACGRASGSWSSLTGIKVGGDGEGALFDDNPAFRHVEKAADAKDAYSRAWWVERRGYSVDQNGRMT